MKNMKNIQKAVVAVGLCLGFASCNDFFEVYPLNEIVLEKYYTEENDIKSVVNSCYAGMENPDFINRVAAWGEIRSDNLSEGSGVANDETQVLRENILPNTKYADWSSIYTVINRCNIVLYYAPLVYERDPNYTESEMRANIAEVKAIRALCYFYLVRTFRNVPFVVDASIDDKQVYKVPASSFDVILDYLIADLESVREDAVRKYPLEVDNTSRFTRYSISALLADLYLWKGDYDNCVAHCDRVIDFKKEHYEEELELQGNSLDIALFNDIPLIQEQRTGATWSGNSTSQIFGEGNSFESIFELNYVDNQSQANTYVSQYYGSSSTTIGQFSATPFLYENAATGANTLFKRTDCRYLGFMTASGTLYGISKYVASMVQFNTPTATGTTAPTVSSSLRSQNFANWIVYRLSDIVLMKAEALVQQAATNAADSTFDATSHMQTALRLVSATYNRANNLGKNSADTLKYSEHAATIATMESLVLAERQRELMFEGKRWFDLLRMARRQGNNQELINHVIKKQKSNTNAIRIRLTSIDGLYFPYSEKELKLNPELKQNPAYKTDETSSITE